MPIRINLLAEAHLQEDMRRRDPVKRTIYIGAFFVALALVWSSSRLLSDMMAKRDLTQVDQAIQSRTNEYDRVVVEMKRVADAQAKLGALEKFDQARLLQGNLMNALQQISTPNVELTRIRVDQAYIYTEGAAGKTTQFGAIAGRPPTSTERIVVTLDAKDSSSNPGDQVNKFKDAVASHAYFQAVLDKTNSVSLASLSSPQTGPDGKPFVLFTLECRYLDHIR